MLTTPLGLSIKPSLMASFLLLFSTNAATAVAKHEITSPIPILCLTLSPRPLGNKGTRMRSYTITHIVKVMIINALKLVDGMFIWNTTLFMVPAWTTEKDCWLMVVASMMPVDQMGRTLIMAFNSSTCLTVHKLHGSIGIPSQSKSFSLFFIMQALFKNLARRGESNTELTYTK
ncbi:hypothetical protein CR513_17542, partial [Mucuna pruriens]